MEKIRLVAVALVLWLSFFVQLSFAAVERFLVGYAGMSSDLSHVWIAKEAGLFEKYGVDVVPIYFSGGRPLVQARLAGDIELAATGGITSIKVVSLIACISRAIFGTTIGIDPRKILELLSAKL